MTAGFKESSRHYLTSSSDIAAGAVVPSNEDDLGKVLQIIGKYRVPFAVRALFSFDRDMTINSI